MEALEFGMSCNETWTRKEMKYEREKLSITEMNQHLQMTALLEFI